jgi:hypothetical protein
LLSLALDASRGRRWRLVAVAAVGLSLAEQVSLVEHRDKERERRWVAAVARRVDPSAAAFFVTRQGRRPNPDVVQVDAMWATTLAGRPTVNGYSGVLPPAWERLRHAPEARGSHPQLARWLALHGVASRVQWIPLGASHRNRPVGLLDPRGRAWRRAAPRPPR